MNNFLLASTASGITFMVLLAIMTIVVFALAVWVLCLGLKDDVRLKLKPKYIFLIVLLIGAAVRMVLAFSMRGLVGTLNSDSLDRTGYTGIVSMLQSLLNSGFNEFYDIYDGVMLYPLAMFILSFFGSICSLFWNVSIGSQAALIFIKLPFIISDILLAFTVYKIAAKYTNELVALAVGGLVAVCPVFMLSSIWPSVYTFYALALAIMMYLMLERKYNLLVITYTVCLLLCFEAVYLFPVVAVFVIYAYIKKVKAYREKGTGKVESLWQSEYGLIIKLPVTIVVCMVASYLIILPFALSGVGANPFVILYAYYLKPFDKFGYFTYNGLSLYTVFDRNGTKLSLSFPTYLFSVLFAAAIIAVTLIVYLSKKNRANLVLFVSYLLLTLNVYFVNSFEMTLLPFLAVLLISIAVLKDKRLLKVFVLVALFTFLNAAGVLLKADYFTLRAAYVSELLDGIWKVLSIGCSVIIVLTHVYYTVVMIDIIMNSRIMKLSSETNKFTSSLKGLLKKDKD